MLGKLSDDRNIIVNLISFIGSTFFAACCLHNQLYLLRLFLISQLVEVNYVYSLYLAYSILPFI